MLLRAREHSSFHLALALGVGLLAVWLSGLNLVWSFLVISFLLLLGVIPILTYSKINLPFFFLCLYALFIPADMSKAFQFYVGKEEAVKYLSLQDVISFFMIGFWVIENMIGKESRKIQFSDILLPYFFLVLWGELSMINALKPHLTLLHSTTFIKWFFVLMAVSNMMRTRKRFEVVFLCLAAGVVFQAIYVFMQVKFGLVLALEGQKTTALGRGLNFGTGFEQILRPSGTFHHPNVLGSFMVYCVPIFFMFTLIKKKFISQLPFYVTVTAGAYALLMSYSRGGWAGCALAIMLILIIASRKKLIKAKTVASIALSGLVLAGLFFPLWKPLAWRLTRSDDFATASRVVLLQQAYLMTSAHPLLGVGLGNYAETSRDYLPERSNLIRFAPKGYIAHNRYAVVAGETGFVGLFIFLWFLWRVAKTAYVNMHTTKGDIQLISIGLFGALMGIYAAMMVDHFSDNTRNIMFFFFTALIVSIQFYFRENPKSQAAR